MSKLSLRCMIPICCAALAACVEQPSPAPAADLTIEKLLDIAHPSDARWSPGSDRVAFVSDLSGAQNIWIAAPGDPGGEADLQSLTSFDSGLIDDLFWNKQGDTLYFGHGGDLWSVGADGSSPPRAVWTTDEVESELAPSPDGRSVAFIRGGTLGTPQWQRNEGDLWVRSLVSQNEIRLTDTLGVVESNPAWSPDGSKIVYTVTESSRHAITPEYSGAKMDYTYLKRAPSDVALISAAGGRAATLAASPGYERYPRWIDSNRVLIERVSSDVKLREILMVDAATGQEHVLHRDVDDRWWSLNYLGANPMPSPDGRWIAFITDQDGWDQLYVVPSSGDTPIQLTEGSFEVRNPSWSPDSTRIAFDTNEGENPGMRHIAVANLGDDPSSAETVKLTGGRGTNIAPRWSPDGNRLVYQHTDPQTSAELFLISAAAVEEPVRLTSCFPAAVDRSRLVAPELVSYTANDGQEVPAYLFVPPGLDRSRKHPAVVWIHGDGINQNYDGWHIQRNYAVYYSFHQYLVQQGYVVLAPDYRGSIGYGKSWRQEAYLEVGGKDYQDIPPAVDYLGTLGFVDTDRVGVWGLSYGGFFTVIALTDQPELFRCGIDVAGPVDYRMYYEDPYHGAWTVARMGTPEENPVVYDVASPIQRVNRIVRPLLVLHGTADVNVPFIHSVLLLDRLLKLDKDVELMMYPGEFHYFHRAHVLRDAWQRAEQFFDAHLKTQ